ncbi:MAG: hypothetical protein ACIARR_06070 [Phycisphaerales bacterium JB059]
MTTGVSVEERLCRLERSVSFWKRATLGLVALGGAGVVLGAAFKPKTMSVDRLHVSEEIVVGDAEGVKGAFVTIGVAARGQDVSDRAKYLEADKQAAYITLRNGLSRASIDMSADEGSAHTYYHTDGSMIFVEAAGEREKGMTRLQLRQMGAPELFWSMGTHPDAGYGFLMEDGEQRSVLP